MSYETIEHYYKIGLFTKQDLDLFVNCGWISLTERNKIIGSI